MRNNIFTLFLNKILAAPFWVKQVIYLRLAQEMQEKSYKEILQNNPQNIFATFVPTITYKGRTELTEKICGFDNNIYNFLQYCIDGFSILEISVNTYLSIEEVAKYYELCLEQGFIQTSHSLEINTMAEYISGKIRLGEYFNKKGIITSEQLNQAISFQQNSNDKKFGETLVELGFIAKDDLKAVLTLKEEAQKRFILDYNNTPTSKTRFANESQQINEEIKILKEENRNLKRKMSQLLKLVKKNA